MLDGPVSVGILQETLTVLSFQFSHTVALHVLRLNGKVTYISQRGYVCILNIISLKSIS